MRRAPRWGLPIVYAIVGAIPIRGALLSLGGRVPGGARTDLWNSLWSAWFLADSARSGQVPYHTAWLDHPDGGTLLVSDPLGAGLTGLASLVVGLPFAFTLLVWLQLTWSGIAAHLFAESVLEGQGARSAASAWVAGVGYATAAILISAVHNGTSEAFAGGWAPFAAWACLEAVRKAGKRRLLLAAVGLVLAALASWYSAVVAFTFAGFLVLLGPGGPWRRGLGIRVGVFLLGLALVAPLAAVVRAASTAPDNLVGIKDAREVATVRRTTGPADPVGYLAIGDYRSPDFRVLSRYGEGFFHCHYLGWVLLILALPAVRRRGLGWVWLGGLCCLVLSLGPVLARQGSAVIVMGDRAIPLPFILVERLPGFSSLSLLYRLAQGPSLAVAVLAAVSLADRGPWLRGAAVAAILLDARLLSPIGLSPDSSPAQVAPAIEALAEAPEGAVMNFPVVGGRAYLFEQTVHHKPIAGTLNFPNNLAAKRVWRELLADHADGGLVPAVTREARKQGIRYLVVHVDPLARPDMHDAAVRAVRDSYEPLAGRVGVGDGAGNSDTAVRVYKLW